MHRWMMENVQKIKIKLENIWIDLIRGIYAPYNKQEHIPSTGEFHPSLHPPFYPFHLCNLSTGAFVPIEVQILKPTSKRKSPSFPLHHSCIRPTPSQIHRDYFLIHKNPESFSYRHTSISREHFMYTTI